MNDENKPRTIEDRLIELKEWGINPQIKVAYKRLLRKTYKYLEGELIDVYQEGYREWIYGSPYRRKFKTPCESCNENTSLYDAVKREVGYERAEEVMDDSKIVKEVELHIIGKLEQPEPMKVYIFEYPSRFFLKIANPNYPGKYQSDVDKLLGEINIPEDEKKSGGRRKTTRSSKK